MTNHTDLNQIDLESLKTLNDFMIEALANRLIQLQSMSGKDYAFFNGFKLQQCRFGHYAHKKDENGKLIVLRAPTKVRLLEQITTYLLRGNLND